MALHDCKRDRARQKNSGTKINCHTIIIIKCITFTPFSCAADPSFNILQHALPQQYGTSGIGVCQSKCEVLPIRATANVQDQHFF